MDLTKVDIPRGKELPREIVEQGTPTGKIPMLNVPYERLVMMVMELQTKVSTCETEILTLKERIKEHGN
jgi:hypothetical protein